MEQPDRTFGSSCSSSCSSSGENGTPTRIRRPKRRRKNMDDDIHWKCSTSSLILFLAMFTALELTVFYGWAYRNVLSPDIDVGPAAGHRPKMNHRDMIRRIQESPNATRIVMTKSNNHTVEQRPLLSVEQRSRADPWPSFPPLVLTSPFVREVHEGDHAVLTAERKMQNTLSHRVARGVLGNGTSINVGFVDIDAEIRRQTHNRSVYGTDLSVRGTWEVLKSMGVDPLAPSPPKKQPDNGGARYQKVETGPPETTEPSPTNWTAQLPPWGQILDNYGAEPVLLGMDRCRAYRDAVPPEQRMIAPAGMFSTGTNLLYMLLISNCLPPPVIDDNITQAESEKTRSRRPKYRKVTIDMRKQFVQWQAPWGKHNPASARLHYATDKQAHVNQSAVFPVVMTRHPYTWIHTICKHSYSARWGHDPTACDHRAGLQNRLSIRFGSNKHDVTTGKQVRTKYNGLTQFYRQWYEPFFLNTDYPMVMTRFEDLIYRPHLLVKQICDCVGGRMLKKFYHRQETVNIGPGHGHHGDSGLLPSFVKYGRPLDEYYEMFSPMDKKMLKMVFEGEQHGLLHAMGYKQFQ